MADFPRIAIAPPVIGILHLIPVFYPLLKHSVLVADAVAVSGIVERCKRIQETRGESTETAVPKPGIRFFIFYILIGKRKFRQQLFHHRAEPRVV